MSTEMRRDKDKKPFAESSGDFISFFFSFRERKKKEPRAKTKQTEIELEIERKHYSGKQTFISGESRIGIINNGESRQD